MLMMEIKDDKAEDGFRANGNMFPAASKDGEIALEEDGPEIDETGGDDKDNNDFMELYENSLKSIREGKVVKGEIVQIDTEFVLVDIGYKSEGQIRISEFTDLEGQTSIKVGDKVDVLIVRKEDKEGRVILSKEKASRFKIWDELEEAHKNNDTIRGKIISQVKGGLLVDIGLQAFLPGSQADIRPVRDLSALVGTEHDFRILKYEKRHGDIVLSRRAALEADRNSMREKTLKLLEKDAILDGIISNITDYGLFIDLGGIDGLAHITDLSWGKVNDPSEMYRIGDNITVKVLNFDKERGRVSLGIKQLSPDPWSSVQEKYPVGTVITGRVERLKDYGAFVELEEGIGGLLHISEMSWTENIKHPSRILSVGETVETVVLDLDIEKRRISLSMKQLNPNPWDKIAENYPIGAIIEGSIINITKFGIFIGIDEGIDGLVHISDISWTKYIDDPSRLYKKGDKIRAVILDIDKEKERFSLGIKQLTPDPWSLIPDKYTCGTQVSGNVTSITDFGVFVELEPGIEGLIHVSQLPKDKKNDPLKKFQIDDHIMAEVVSVSQEEKRIGLSLLKRKADSAKDNRTFDSNKKEQATSNLGDLIKEKMMDLQAQASLDKKES